MLKKIALSPLIAMMLISCQIQDRDQKPKYLNNFNDLITETNGAAYKGTVQSFITDNNEIGIKLMGDTNKLYVLQGYKGAKKININTKDGQIIYLKHALVVNTGDPSKIYYFGVEKPEEIKIRNKVETKTSLADKMLGYGLAQIDISNFNKYEFKTDQSIYRSLAKGSELQ